MAFHNTYAAMWCAEVARQAAGRNCRGWFSREVFYKTGS